ncbi:hypothetical protein [Proteus mirabilis]
MHENALVQLVVLLLADSVVLLLFAQKLKPLRLPSPYFYFLEFASLGSF